MRCLASARVYCLLLVAMVFPAGCGRQPELTRSRALRFLEGEDIDLGIVPGTSHHVFTLLNQSDRTVRVSKVATSCGCAAAIVREGGRIVLSGGRCALDFTLTVSAGQVRRTSLTVLTTDGEVANLEITAEGRASQWRACREQVDVGCIWLGDEARATVLVESLTPCLEADDPPHANWVCRDSSRVHLGMRGLKRRPEGIYEASCSIRVAPTHLGRYSATVTCEIEGAVVPIALSWKVASPLGLESHRIRVPLRDDSVSIPLAIASGLSIVRVVSAAATTDIACVLDGDSAARPKWTLTIRRQPGGDGRAPLGIREIDVSLEEALEERQFTSPLTLLLTEP